MDRTLKVIERNHAFDLARAVCVIWIVAFFHMLNYFPKESQFPEMTAMVCYDITICVLACFTFLSGYFLSKYRFDNKSDVVTFYKKRFTRFFPLFVIASFSLLICGSSIRQILLAIGGLSLIIPPPIYTLWYMSMLMLFYLMTPLLKYEKDSLSFKWICVAFIAIVMVLSFKYADRRLTLYFPFYVLGLNLPKQIVDIITERLWTLVAFIALCVLMYVRLKIYPNYLSNFILPVEAFFGVWFILSISKLIYTDRIFKPVTFFSEASLCAYLFHRAIYALILLIVGCQFMTIPLAIISVVLLFILSYYLQKIYNHIVKRLS